MASVRSSGEGNGCIMVLAVVLPQCISVHISGSVINLEPVSVEISDEILGRGTACGTSRIDVAEKHPFLFIRALHREFEQVRTFPDTVVAAVSESETGLLLPFNQIVGGVDAHFLTAGQNEVPFADFIVPEHVRIPEIHNARSKDRIALVLDEGVAPIEGIGKGLRLDLTCARIDCDDGAGSETGSILLIHNAGTTENVSQCIRLDGIRTKFPMNEVAAHRVSPGKIVPHRTVWAVLIIQMPFPVLPEHSVRVVHPAVCRRMMVLRTEFLLVRTVI